MNQHKTKKRQTKLTPEQIAHRRRMQKQLRQAEMARRQRKSLHRSHALWNIFITACIGVMIGSGVTAMVSVMS